jgi:hypothetical protein
VFAAGCTSEAERQQGTGIVLWAHCIKRLLPPSSLRRLSSSLSPMDRFRDAMRAGPELVLGASDDRDVTGTFPCCVLGVLGAPSSGGGLSLTDGGQLSIVNPTITLNTGNQAVL